MGRPTINDVAHAAGVSKGAVSFALNGRPGISPDTRTPHPRGRREPRLVAEPAGPCAVGVQGAGRRPGHRPAARDPARRRVLPVVHRRSGDRAVDPRPRAAAPGRRARRPRGVPPAGAGGPRRRRLRHRPRRSTTSAPHCSRSSACRRSSSAPTSVSSPGRASRPSAWTTPPASAPPSSTSSSSATATSRTSPARSASSTAVRASWPGARRSQDAGLPEGVCVEADFSAESGASAMRDPARPRRPPHRRGLRQRPDGDGRPLAGHLPRSLGARRPVGHRLRRRRDLRTPPALADLGAHRRRRDGPRSRHPAARSSSTSRNRPLQISRTHGSSCVPPPDPSSADPPPR